MENQSNSLLSLEELDKKKITYFSDAEKTPLDVFVLALEIQELARAISTLGKCPHLQFLYLQSGSHGSEAWNISHHLGNIKNVQKIYFAGFIASPEFLTNIKVFSALPHLKCLQFDGRQMTKEHFEAAQFSQFKNLEKIIISDRTNASGYVPGSYMLKAEQQEVLTKPKKDLPKIEVLFGTPFEDFEDLTELGSSLCEKGTAHISDLPLKKLYWHLTADSYRAAVYGEAHLDEIDDKLAVLEAVEFAFKSLKKNYSKLVGFKWSADRIAKEYFNDYYGKDLAYFETKLKEVSQKISSLRNAGHKSTVFSTYLNIKKKQDGERDEAAEDFVEEMFNDEKLKPE